MLVNAAAAACLSETLAVVGRYFRQGTLLHHYGEVLAIMMRLRQMCCHPFLVAKAADKITETIGKYLRLCVAVSVVEKS